MMTSADVRALVRDVVTPIVRAPLIQAGFHVSRRGELVRRAGESDQFINLGLDVAPRYAPEALVVLQPTLRVELAPLVPYLERDDLPGSGSALVQPLAHGGTRNQWPIFATTEAASVAADLADDLRVRAIPLLDDLSSGAALALAHDRRDPRVLWQYPTYAAVVAAHALAGNLAEARAVAAIRFRGDGLQVSFPKVARLLAG
jgi:hypothetical protein